METSINQRLEAFNLALEAHSGALLHFFFSLSKNWETAEDLSQELWSKVHRYFSPSQYQDKPLLYRKARQVFIDYYPKVKVRPDLAPSDDPYRDAHNDLINYQGIDMPTREEADSPEDEERLFRNFWEMFYPDEYDELCKRIFWFHARYDYTLAEISEMMNLPKSTTHDKLQAIKSRCRQRLTNSNL